MLVVVHSEIDEVSRVYDPIAAPSKSKAGRREYAKIWRQRNPERAIAKDRQRNVVYKSNFMLKTIRHKCKRRGLPFDLTVEWLEEQIAKRCALSGREFDRGFRLGSKRPLCPSVDRKVPSAGYTMVNCRVILSCLNIGLLDWGDDFIIPVWADVVRGIS